MEDVQSIKLTNREQLELTGVVHVDSFDDDEVILETKMGALVIKGQNLNINELNLESGKVKIQGAVGSLQYFDESKNLKNRGKGILDRLLK